MPECGSLKYPEAERKNGLYKGALDGFPISRRKKTD
jgi:hypothetical protein